MPTVHGLLNHIGNSMCLFSMQQWCSQPLAGRVLATCLPFACLTCLLHVASASAAVLCPCCAQAGPVWVQIHRLLGAPAPVLQLMQRRHQQRVEEDAWRAARPEDGTLEANLLEALRVLGG